MAASPDDVDVDVDIASRRNKQVSRRPVLNKNVGRALEPSLGVSGSVPAPHFELTQSGPNSAKCFFAQSEKIQLSETEADAFWDDFFSVTTSLVTRDADVTVVAVSETIFSVKIRAKRPENSNQTENLRRFFVFLESQGIEMAGAETLASLSE